MNDLDRAYFGRAGQETDQIGFIDQGGQSSVAAIAFAVCQPDDPTEIESLIIVRTPKYEFFLEAWERGASVSFHRNPQDDERAMLREVVYAVDDKCITLRSDRRNFKLDVRKVDPSELSAMGRVFRKMNFDSSIKLSGV
jgi:hypothetical protein